MNYFDTTYGLMVKGNLKKIAEKCFLVKNKFRLSFNYQFRIFDYHIFVAQS